MAYPLLREEIETIMKEGSDAFLMDITQKECPYSKYGERGRLWLKGWANSHYGYNMSLEKKMSLPNEERPIE